VYNASLLDGVATITPPLAAPVVVHGFYYQNVTEDQMPGRASLLFRYVAYLSGVVSLNVGGRRALSSIITLTSPEVLRTVLLVFKDGNIIISLN
jgi:hypothetical protein